MRCLLVVVAFVVFTTTVFAAENARDQIYKDTSGLEARDRPISATERTLVVFHAGQSNRVNIHPTLYIPAHTLQVDNFNINDGRLYEIKGPMLGASFPDPPRHMGNISARIDDLIIEKGIADRVISVTIAVGSTKIRDWSHGRMSDRFAVAIKHLASRDIVPGPRVKFIVDWSQGPTDTLDETSGAVWKAEFLKIVVAAEAAGFSGLWFVSSETWVIGIVAPMIHAAQISVCDGVKILRGFDSDSLGAGFRADRAGHFNDAGASIVAAGVVGMILAAAPLF